MKTYLIAFLIFAFALTSTAQKVSDKKSMTTVNAMYLSQVYAKDNAIKVNKLQNLASQYDIRKSNIYNNKSKNTYEVIFEESNCKIVATYDVNSEIIESDETFNQIRLPHQLAVKIAKDYPRWKVENKSYHISYKKEQPVEKTFSITINNNSISKILKFGIVESDEMSFVALN